MVQAGVLLLALLGSVLFGVFKLKKFIDVLILNKLKKTLSKHPETLSLTKVGFQNERGGTNFNWPVYQVDGSEIIVFRSWSNPPENHNKLGSDVLKPEKISLTKEKLYTSILKKEQTYSYVKYGSFLKI